MNKKNYGISAKLLSVCFDIKSLKTLNNLLIIVNYFYVQSENDTKQQPRGFIFLESAVISPSDEDSNTFSVNSWNGECYKLRAADARARQDWVNRLRTAAEYHSQVIISFEHGLWFKI